MFLNAVVHTPVGVFRGHLDYDSNIDEAGLNQRCDNIIIEGELSEFYLMSGRNTIFIPEHICRQSVIVFSIDDQPLE